VGRVRPLIGDVRLHVSVLGDEWRDGVRFPVLVALHGGPGVDGSKLRQLLRPAVDFAQVIVPDQRGHGYSDRSDAAHWNLDVWADDLARLVDVLGVDRPVVLGTSFGGFVVQRYLARYPDRPAAAVLVATAPRAVDREAAVERFRAVGGDRAADAMARSFREATPEAEREWREVCAPLLARHEPAAEVREALRHRIHSTEVNLHFTPTLATMDLRPGLREVRCPVLVLAGADDPLISPDSSAEIVTALPAGLGELHVLPDAGHDVLSDRPARGHSVIRRFLQLRGPRPGAGDSAAGVEGAEGVMGAEGVDLDGSGAERLHVDAEGGRPGRRR